MANYLDNLTPEVKKTIKDSLEAKGIKHNISIEEEVEDVPIIQLETLLQPKFDEKYLVQTKVSLSTSAQVLLDSAESLHQAHTQYEQEFVLKGHNAVYKLLENMHRLATQIKASPDSEVILKMMRDFLKEKYNINLNKSSTAMGTLVRYVIRADKLTASRYGKVLAVAQEEGIKPENFINFVKDRGGISKITATHAETLVQMDTKRTQAARLDFAREICSLLGMTSSNDVSFSKGIIRHRQDKDRKKDVSRFVYFLAEYLGEDNYRLVSGHDFDRSFEDQILAQIAKHLPSDLGMIEQSVRKFMHQILKSDSLLKGQRDYLMRELKKPLAYAKDSAKSVDMVDTDVVAIPHEHE